MIEENASILENMRIAADIYRLKLATKTGDGAHPGQFVELQIPGFFLRRPISISSIEKEQITLIYKIAGRGTEYLSHMKKGETINLFGPLGNGFPVIKKDVLLIGGGVGLPPLYETARQYIQLGQKVTLAAGFGKSGDVFYEDEFRQLGVDVSIATMDGSYGIKGTALDVVNRYHLSTDFILACGPLPMLKAVSEQYSNGYLSIESRMGCGLGACNGCVMKTVDGSSVRVCYDGPVFPIGKVVL